MQPSLSRASEAMARYAEGDDLAFDLLYDELSPKLYAYLRRMFGARAGADDALQQTFLRIHQHRGRFVRGARVEPWAFAIARSVGLDALRGSQRRATEALLEEEHASGVSDAEADYAGVELSAALREELSGLSPLLREAFLLVRVDGLSHAEAAEVLGARETATKVRAHRAGVWLRQKLARFAGQLDDKEDP